MPATMPRPQAQKNPRVLAFVPANGTPRRYRERPARVFTSSELRLDDDLRGLFDDVRDQDGQYPTPEFERVARGNGWPLRIFARYIVRAAKKGADESTCLAIVDRLAVFVRDVFRKYGRRDQRAA